ncbi:hypothetical protein BgiBS90_002163, partial [Biomphalaria glabrata]
MAAPRSDRVDSSRRLCARYRKFFIAAGVTLGLQILLCHYFLNLSQRSEDINFIISGDNSVKKISTTE